MVFRTLRGVLPGEIYTQVILLRPKTPTICWIEMIFGSAVFVYDSYRAYVHSRQPWKRLHLIFVRWEPGSTCTEKQEDENSHCILTNFFITATLSLGTLAQLGGGRYMFSPPPPRPPTLPGILALGTT